MINTPLFQTKGTRTPINEDILIPPEDRAAEAAASPNLALKYDTRSYDWLPEFARISNDTSIYGK